MYKKPVELKPDPAQEPEPKLSPAKERLVSELRRLQTHDPDVILMQGVATGRSSRMHREGSNRSNP